MAIKNVDLTTTVLVVDDLRSARALVKNYLRILGFTQVEEAENGIRALERIQKGGVGLVISDWQMPDMEGIELVDHIRSHHKFVELPFIMVTAQQGHERMAEAAVQGVSGYLRKPFSVDVLEQEINEVFADLEENRAE